MLSGWERGNDVSYEDNKALWRRWQDLWNGDLAIADGIIAPGFVARFAPVGNSPGEVRGPEALKGWIGGSLEAFDDHRFTTVVGPVIDGDTVAGRWVFRAAYRGGIPGASDAAVGSRVEYAGMDIFRVDSSGKIAEYWLCADILVMLQQVGAVPS